jgi:hypothetical protein
MFLSSSSFSDDDDDESNRSIESQSQERAPDLKKKNGPDPLSFFLVRNEANNPFFIFKEEKQTRTESHTGPVRHTLASTQADVKVGGDATAQHSSCEQQQPKMKKIYKNKYIDDPNDTAAAARDRRHVWKNKRNTQVFDRKKSTDKNCSWSYRPHCCCPFETGVAVRLR